MIKTYLPHTHENQAILREYGQKIAGRFGRQGDLIQGPSLWSRIWNYFPGSQAVGYKAGEHLALTYGAQWSNRIIDFVVERFFPAPIQAPPSFWDSIKKFFSGVAGSTLAETLKLTLTPKIVPCIALVSGTMASIGLPTLICLVSFAYQKAMFDPRKLQQLSRLTPNELFKIDPETGRLRDAFGRLMSVEDMRDILTGAAKYDLVCKLIELCHQIDQKEGNDDALQEETKKMIHTFVESYCIQRSDNKIIFPDGEVCTAEDQETIQKGIADLSRINPCHKAKNIRKLIKLLGKHSLAPLETLSPCEKIGVTGNPKRMPTIFPEGDQAWKNAIIRTDDGNYVIAREVGEKKRGTVIETREIFDIFAELKAIQRTQSTA